MKKLIFLLIGIQALATAMVYAQDITVVKPSYSIVGFAPDSIRNAVQRNSQRLKLNSNIIKIFYTKDSQTFIVAKLSRFTLNVSFILIKYDGKSVTVENSNFIPRVRDFESSVQRGNLKRPSPKT